MKQAFRLGRKDIMLLKEPIQIGSLNLQNRLVMPPMHTGKSPNGKVTPALCDYYRQRSAEGAVGLVITEYSYVSQQGKASPTQLSLAEDSDIESHRMLVDAVHEAGSRVFAQINHAGGAASEKVTGMEVVAPSAVAHPWSKPGTPLPRALTVEEIRQIEDDYVSAAVRAQKAGYDGVEIHGVHAYLFNQFFSPLLNHRHDEYGCDSVEDRARIIVETVEKIRASLGRGYPLAVRLCGSDYREGGSTVADCVAACRLLAKAGVDLIDISGGLCGYMNPEDNQPGYFGEGSKAVKDELSLPVLLTGGVKEADEAEKLLAEGKADLIGVGRALMKDADWARKAMM